MIVDFLVADAMITGGNRAWQNMVGIEKTSHSSSCQYNPMYHPLQLFLVFFNPYRIPVVKEENTRAMVVMAYNKQLCP